MNDQERPVVAAAARVAAPVEAAGEAGPVEGLIFLLESLERVTAERDAFRDERNEARRGLEMCDAEISGLRVRAGRVEAERDEALARIEGQANTIGSLRVVARYAGLVMETLEAHGPGIVGHLLDTDDNDGQRLREALRAVSLGDDRLPDGERIADDNGDELEHGSDDGETGR